MKRYGNLFEKITELDNIYLAYRKARKGKSWQNTISRFDDDLDENIFNIRDSLVEKTFTTSPYIEKIIYEPKQRTIYKLPFDPDRVVQHALMNVLEPIWSSLFIYDSYACKDKKFLHHMAEEIESFLDGALALKLSKCDVFPVAQGIDFLGYRHFPDHILLRKSTAKRIKRRMKDLPGQLTRGEITPDQYRSSVASTEGWLLWANSYNFKQSLEVAYA